VAEKRREDQGVAGFFVSAVPNLRGSGWPAGRGNKSNIVYSNVSGLIKAEGDRESGKVGRNEQKNKLGRLLYVEPGSGTTSTPTAKRRQNRLTISMAP